MKSFHIKSIILGIGIGAILTSIIGMIFMAGYNPNNAKLTDTQIIEKAKSLGMLEAKSILEVSNPGDTKLESEGTDISSTKNNIIENSEQAATKQKVVTTPVPVKTETELTIEVVKGDTSEKVAQKLFDIKLINDKKGFIDELTKEGLTMEINIGQYKIKQGLDIKKIIKILTTIS